MFLTFVIGQITFPKVRKTKVTFVTSHLTVTHILGYNNRFKRRMQRSHPNIWSFIDSIKNEVQTVHDLVSQINSGMEPREKNSIETCHTEN